QGFEAPPLAGPGLVQKATNLAKATVRHTISGFKDVPTETQEARYAICQACPSQCYKPKSDSCTLCGCIMKTKTAWSTASCPAGHWSRWKKGDEPPQLPPGPDITSSSQPPTTATASQPQSDGP